MGKNRPITSIDRDAVVAVTGATGMLGRSLVARLVDTGAVIRLVSRHAARCEPLLRSFPAGRFEVVGTELVEPHGMRKAFRGADLVFHCAAGVSFRGLEDGEAGLVGINTSLAHHVVNACLEAGTGRLVHVSSIASLGRRNSEPKMDEGSYPENLDGWNDYAVSKYYSENEVWRGIHRGLDAVIVNPAVILGSGDWKGHGSPALFDFFARGIPFYTAGVTGYVDVEDVARAMTALAVEPSASGRRFVLCAENLSYREIIGLIARSVGKRPPTVELGEKSLKMSALASRWLSRLTGKEQKITEQIIRAAVNRCHYDGGAVREVIGFEYTPIEQTVARIAAEYLKQKNQ